MRLLNARTLAFEEFFDDQIPKYAILSHRWGSLDDEVSYTDYISGAKRSTSGYQKIRRFCELARDHANYCWIDTCCIDKSSSAELTEAINSMYMWYKRSEVCFAYLKDVSTAEELPTSDWFNRGWTLQELIAPTHFVFLDAEWSYIGTRQDLNHLISNASKIDAALLSGRRDPGQYSAAQIMSWAAHRTTARIEDRAYSLLGLFGVNMPLIYGEGEHAFQRLQEEILVRRQDNSIFAWGEASATFDGPITNVTEMFAPSPREFQTCGSISPGFYTHRILFETTNRGIMVSIHNSYDPDTCKNLLVDGLKALIFSSRARHQYGTPGLTIPLGCYQSQKGSQTLSFFLQLVCIDGKWHRAGVVKQYDPRSFAGYKGMHSQAYSNEYTRVYVDHRRKSQHDIQYFASLLKLGSVNYLHLRDSNFKGKRITIEHHADHG